MNDKELNELLEYNQEYMEARLSEDIFGGDYTSEVELKHLKKDYDELQTRWDSLREWLIKQREEYIPTDRYVDGTFDTIDEILDKMNELEGVDNEV